MRFLFSRPLLLLLLLVGAWWFLRDLIASVEDTVRQTFAWMFPF